MTISDDFIRKYGKEKFEKAIKLAGHHSTKSGYLSVCSREELEAFNDFSDDEKLIFSLLEMLDYQCYKFDYYCNIGLSEEDIKSFLLEHKNEVLNMNIPPPSLLGVIVGEYSFLQNGEG